MTIPAQSNLVDSIWTALKGNASITALVPVDSIWYVDAPTNLGPPYVVFSIYGDLESEFFDDQIRSIYCLLDICVHSPKDAGPRACELIAATIYERLHRTTVSSDQLNAVSIYGEKKGNPALEDQMYVQRMSFRIQGSIGTAL